MTLHVALSRHFDHSILRRIGIAVIASLLLTLSAKISIPFYPDLQTVQNVLVLGLGLALVPGLTAVVFPAARRDLKLRGIA